MTKNLEGKLALIITNAESQIGEATAELFVSRGADLALVELVSNSSRVVVDELANDLRKRHPSRNVSTHRFDSSDRNREAEKLFDEIKVSHPAFECPNVLVTAAPHMLGAPKGLLETTEHDFDEMVDSSLRVIHTQVAWSIYNVAGDSIMLFF